MDYWIEISQHGTRLGAGFQLTRRYAVTASHCLRGLTSDELLELSFAGGEVGPGRIHERSPESDLALIDIVKPRESSVVLPSADRACRGDSWAAPYRPGPSDPYLSGEVLNGGMSYRCEAGNLIEALQLGCSERLGDYSGYSGGPVERPAEAGDPVVLGVLLEQYPDRECPSRSSDVLFAATVAEILRRFDSFNVGHLLKVLTADSKPSQGDRPDIPATTDALDPLMTSDESSLSLVGRSLQSRLAETSSLLDALHEWGKSGVLDPMDVSMLKMQVVRRIIDSDGGDGV